MRTGALAAACVIGIAFGATEVRAAGPSTPFGSHDQDYADDALAPSLPQKRLDASTGAAYDQWKSLYLKAGCAAGQYYVKADTETAMVVSESQGYGMLIAPLMAGHDPDAKKIFDGLLKYYLAHPSSVDARLMSGSQDKSCKDIDGGDSATDGDLDAAYGLLLADKQWGSDGEINYLAAAKRVLAGLYASDVNPKTRLVNLGDWASKDKGKFRYATRTSDWMPGHFRAFSKVDKRWAEVFRAHVAIIRKMQEEFSPETGLLPDFIINADTSPRPAPANFLESKDDGKYSYNACRDPWRIGVLAVTTPSPKARAAVARINRWARVAANGKPDRLRAGYALNGKPLANYDDLSFTAPFAVAAMAGKGRADQAWLDALWGAIEKAKPQGYYADTLKLLAMITVSRNWLKP